ncbi:unnamed protein product [Lactuca saligna]|uniref:Uncharacterized protein n=1 Tax=Lactuca saligna TaxID=75948 RepID=A0AA35VYG8_LACSI|nr:unnamed protein product [Lactuca saligna]
MTFCQFFIDTCSSHLFFTVFVPNHVFFSIASASFLSCCSQHGGFHHFFSPIILLHHIFSKSICVPSNVSPLILQTTIDLSTFVQQGSSKNQERILALLVLVVRRRGLLVAVTGGVVVFRCRKLIAWWQLCSTAMSSNQFSPGNVARHHGPSHCRSPPPIVPAGDSPRNSWCANIASSPDFLLLFLH